MNENEFNIHRPTQPAHGVSPLFHTEEVVVGVELNNYTKRTPSEDGTYVTIVNHTERIEKIRQPLTPEERAAQRKQEAIVGGIVGGAVLLFVGLIGYAIYKEEQAHRSSQDDAR